MEGEFSRFLHHIYIGGIMLSLFKESESLICNGKVLLKKKKKEKECQLRIKFLTNSEMSV